MKNYLVIIFLCIPFFLSAEKGVGDLEGEKDGPPVQRWDPSGRLFSRDWSFTASAGPAMYFSDHDKRIMLTDGRITPNFNVMIAKSFSPIFDVAIGVHGGSLKGLTKNGGYSTGELFDSRSNLYRQEIKFMNYYANAMVNLTAMKYGFDRNRIHHLSVFAGVGSIRASNYPANKSFSLDIGFRNSLRMTNAIHLFADVKGTLVDDHFDDETGGRKGEGILSVLAGVKFVIRSGHLFR